MSKRKTWFPWTRHTDPTSPGAEDEQPSLLVIDEIDGLTLLGNRRRLDRDLADTLALADDAGFPVAFAIVDVDNFRLYNEVHGHVAGDEALRRLTEIITSNVREEDVVYRYRGKQFSILFRGTNRGLAHEIVHRIRAAVEATSFAGEQTQPGGHLTVSVGVSAIPQCEAPALTAQADEALAQAKGAGRNQVAFAAAQPVASSVG